MDKYLKSYRKLRDGDVLELYDLSPAEADTLKNIWVKTVYGNREWFESPKKQIMLVTEEGNGLIYPSLEVFQKVEQVGFEPCSTFFSYCPSFKIFITRKEDLIRDLLVSLNLDLAGATDTKDKIVVLERILQDKGFTERHQVQKLYLGILAYCGEALCSQLDAKWDCVEKDTAGWEPVLKNKSGELIRAFVDLDENIMCYLEGRFFPMLGMRTDLIVQKRVQRTYYTYRLPGDDTDN
jgi:hypothetical protein